MWHHRLLLIKAALLAPQIQLPHCASSILPHAWAKREFEQLLFVPILIRSFSADTIAFVIFPTFVSK
jgi:hypothetical protein